MQVTCDACGTESPQGFKFCPDCGASLADAMASDAVAPRPSPAVTEERRTVTALFCDLVGFTATSENADPEDVDRMLTAYGEMARAEVELHGGVVEKFIGDAVVGIFGVPIAHEDDAERAVRAGLRICARAAELEGLAGLPLRLRVGINTGEVLARLGVQAGSGERFVSGDAINTASRIQSAAPEMGVAVGPATYRATRANIEYQELEPATLKGKAEPVRVFHAVATRARAGVDLTRSQAARYIGRQDELAVLRAGFEEAQRENAVRLVTVIGEAGMGKSRMIAELRALTQGAGTVTWHQGRCLPYGEGITFWALGEIVKAHAGILESDSPTVAQEKLEAVIPAGAQQAWLRERLLPLIGIESVAPADRDESFAAWRSFLEGMGDGNPTVLVFEDLHWADESMVAFLEHVAGQAEHGPMLLLATARPELLTRHPDFASTLANASRVELAALSNDDTTALVGSLLGAVVPDELVGPIIERAEGNPLYAEEYVRLLRDRDLVVEADGAMALRPGAELPVPESIHALLAARLDTLPAQQKALLGDAAVIGKVFWNGALAEMGGIGAGDVERALSELAALGFLRPAAQSSMEGEHEYAFWHVLGRDVAYRQLPRGSRADRHAAAATWLEGKLGERVDDIADVLADHWGTALELSKAAGRDDRAREMEPKAIAFLVRAGERAMGLDTASALVRFEAAKELAGDAHEQRPHILVRFAETAQHVGRAKEALAAIDEAIEAFETRDDWRAKARALLVKEHAILEALDAITPTRPLIEEAIALLEKHEPTPALVDGLTELGVYELYDLQVAESIETFDRAISVARDLGLPTPGRAIGFRGRARLTLGDTGGMEDFEESIALCLAAGQGRDIAINKINMGVWSWLYDGPAAGIVPMRAAIDDATRYGYPSLAMGMTLLSLQVLRDLGAYDEALETFDRLNMPGSPEMRQTYGSPYRILAVRGRCEGALTAAEEWEGVARESANPEAQVIGRGVAASIRATCGDLESACRLIGEALEIPEVSQADEFVSNHLPDLVRCACEAGNLGLADRLLMIGEPRFPYAEHAQTAGRAFVAERRGNFEEALAGFRDAAERWEKFSIPLEEAYARLGEARCLVALGRQPEADAPLAVARGIFERLGAVAAIQQAESVQAELTAAKR